MPSSFINSFSPIWYVVSTFISSSYISTMFAIPSTSLACALPLKGLHPWGPPLPLEGRCPWLFWVWWCPAEPWGWVGLKELRCPPQGLLERWPGRPYLAQQRSEGWPFPQWSHTVVECGACCIVEVQLTSWVGGCWSRWLTKALLWEVQWLQKPFPY